MRQIAMIGAMVLAGHAIAQPPIRQIASRETLAQFKSMLPRVDDAEIQAVFDSDQTLWYDEQSMPLAYQMDSQSDGVMRVHWVRNNIGPRGSDPFGNANLEWPWFDPHAGPTSSRRVKSFKGIWIPSVGGYRQPVKVFSSVVRGVSSAGNSRFRDRHARHGLSWIFPPGTRIVEVVLNQVAGRDVAFKVLLMRRERDRWFRRAARPFPTIAEYEKVFGPTQLSYKRMSVRDDHPNRVFTESRTVAELPIVPADKVYRALKTIAFKPSLETMFAEGVVAPTTRYTEQAYPAGYLGAFFGPDQESCTNCHRDVGNHASNFEAARDWYGVVRGSDEVFSFHPFEPRSLSPDGHPRPVELRRSFVDQGIVVRR